MSKISKLKKSRMNWKTKAKSRSQLINYLQKENNRIKKERAQYKEEARRAKKSLEAIKKKQ